MRRFLKKLLFLIIIPGIILVVAIILSPPSAAFKKSLFFSLIDKNNRLKFTKPPRIIFVGGSNLSFGLNSQMIKDSLRLNPINTGIHASLGLKFMMNNIRPYIKKNDIVIISAEYEHFYGDFANGEIELLSTVVDVLPKSYQLLDIQQINNLIKYFPTLLSTKVDSWFEKKQTEKEDVGIYDRLSFNTYGDAYRHWNLPKRQFRPTVNFEGQFNTNLLNDIENFEDYLKSRNSKLLITFPCFQDSSFSNTKQQIMLIERKLREKGFTVVSQPETYRTPDYLTFDTVYHLTKKGADWRTKLLIKDIKNYLRSRN